MPKNKTAQEQHVEYHKDGSVWARGQTANGVPTGYWEWFRVDGTKMRSGYFEDGEQVGEWTTYDKKGQVYKVTKMKRAAERKPNALTAKGPKGHNAAEPQPNGELREQPPRMTNDKGTNDKGMTNSQRKRASRETTNVGKIFAAKTILGKIVVKRTKIAAAPGDQHAAALD